MGQRAAQRAALAFLTLVLGLAVLEATLRLLSSSTGLEGSDDGPTSTAFSQTLPGLERTVRYERNRLGLRARSMDSGPKPARTLRVVCLGASTTDQPTQSIENTSCGLLESLLRERFAARGLTVETAARGRGGDGVAAVERWARRHLRSLEPDLVITLLGINDLAFAAALPSLRSTPEKSDAATNTSFGEQCRQASHLCSRLVSVRDRARTLWQPPAPRTLEWHSDHLPALRAQYQQYPLVSEPVRDPDPIDSFSTSLRTLLEFLRAEQMPVLVLGQPVLWKADMSPEEASRLWFPVYTAHGPVRASGEWLAREMRRYNLAQRREADAVGATFVDLDDRVPKTLDFFFDDCHYTDLGSRRVAEEMLPAVAALLEARAGSSPR